MSNYAFETQRPGTIPSGAMFSWLKQLNEGEPE